MGESHKLISHVLGKKFVHSSSSKINICNLETDCNYYNY